MLESSDLLLLSSGTITLEAMLFKKPMVVAYKLNSVTHFFVKMMTYVDHASLPNLMAGKEIVPECLQQQCTPERLLDKLQEWIDQPQKTLELEQEFTSMHMSLKKSNNNSASKAILNLLNSK